MSSSEMQNDEYRNNYVKVYDFNTLSYEHFVVNHLLKNEPCLIRNIVHGNNKNDNWHIYDKWTNKKGDISYKYLRDKYGETIVDVADCGNKSYSDQQRSSMTLSNYLSYLQQQQHKQKTSNNPLNKWLDNIKEGKLSKFDLKHTANILYCKDWHIVRDLKSDCPFYSTPHLFSDDWLNDYWQTKGTTDYKFFYFGPQFSFTPTHKDVYSSYSWSANIIGKKLWILFNPKESAHYLKNRQRNEWVYNVLSLVDCDDISEQYKEKEYPHLSELFDKENQILCKRMIVQNENEAIFVPSNWFHEVYNLSDIVLSVNHNWFNGINIDCIWNCIYTQYQAVCQSIDDLTEFLEENAFYDKCQELLMAAAGIDFDQFLDILRVNTERILKVLVDNDNEESCDDFRNKIYLHSMQNVLNMMEECVKTKCMKGKNLRDLFVIKWNVEQTLKSIKFIKSIQLS